MTLGTKAQLVGLQVETDWGAGRRPCSTRWFLAHDRSLVVGAVAIVLPGVVAIAGALEGCEGAVEVLADDRWDGRGRRHPRRQGRRRRDLGRAEPADGAWSGWPPGPGAGRLGTVVAVVPSVVVVVRRAIVVLGSTSEARTAGTSLPSRALKANAPTSTATRITARAPTRRRRQREGTGTGRSGPSSDRGTVESCSAPWPVESPGASWRASARTAPSATTHFGSSQVLGT